MLVTYIRSSSYKNFDYCQMQYYITYVLGIQRTSGKKADQGTIVHKALECLALIKKQFQDNPNKTTFENDIVGKINIDYDTWLKPTTLSEKEINQINKTRVNKYKYKENAKITGSLTRYGVSLVEDIIDKCYKYYSDKSDLDWYPVDYKDCVNWTWMLLDYENGMFDPRRRNIVAAEPQFDFEINQPWARYYWELPNGRKISGNLRIKGTIDLITQVDSGTLEIVDWKGLPTDTLIPTPDGWTTMGDLKIGDMVLDESGKPTEVVGKSEIKQKPCYKITFDDTSTVICDDEHLWKLRHGLTYPIDKIMVGDKINLTKPLKLPEKELPVDPYVLGIWLGDGRNRNAEVSGEDQFIFDEIISRGYKIGDNIGGEDHCRSHTIYDLTSKLKELNLLHNKHIPSLYLRASYYQRLDLLRGLMDSDGYANKSRKQCVFTNCNKKLSEDVKELLLSLGQRPLLSHVLNKQFGKDIDVYSISFRPININPFMLPRKSVAVEEKWGYGWSNYRKITNIEKVPSKPTQCIMVNSQTSTYLCTKNMIPTHNTGSRVDWAAKNPDKSIKTYASFGKDAQLMMYYYAARRLYPDFKHILVTIFYIRDGGPFTICFTDNHIKELEEKLKNRFEEIKSCQFPEMIDPNQKSFKCTKICDYYKMPSPDGKTNFCKYLNNQMYLEGMESVTNKYTDPKFKIGDYEAPG